MPPGAFWNKMLKNTATLRNECLLTGVGYTVFVISWGKPDPNSSPSWSFFICSTRNQQGQQWHEWQQCHSDALVLFLKQQTRIMSLTNYLTIPHEGVHVVHRWVSHVVHKAQVSQASLNTLFPKPVALRMSVGNVDHKTGFPWVTTITHHHNILCI